MKKFEVTVARTGSIIVEANSAEEAMTLVNEEATSDEIRWADDWPATDAHEVEGEDEDDDQPIMSLPLDDFDIKLAPIGNGYAIRISNGNDTVEAARIVNKQRKIAGHIINDLQLELCFDHDDPNISTKHSLLTPDGRPCVIMLKNERLWCRACHCYVPNTANNEMRKDGCFSHSHICGIRRDVDTYLPPEMVGKDDRPIDAT